MQSDARILSVTVQLLLVRERRETDRPVAPVQWSFDQSNGALSKVGATWAAGVLGSSFPYDVESLARTKTLQKLLSGKATLGVTLAEARKTTTYVAEAGLDIMRQVERLAKGAKASKRAVVETLLGIPTRPPRGGSRRSWAKRQDWVRKRWLEYQFAVRPLYMDIQSSGEALSDLINVEQRAARLTVRAGAEGELRSLYETTSQPAQVRANIPVRRRAFCHISCVYDVPISAARTFSQLGLGNPLSVAWELVSFSWMVDYVLGVGNWLDSMFAASGTQFIEGSMSRKLLVDFPASASFVSSQSDTKLRRGYGPCTTRGEIGRFNRQVLSNLWPAYRPAVRPRLGLTRLANVLAVLPSIASRVGGT